MKRGISIAVLLLKSADKIVKGHQVQNLGNLGLKSGNFFILDKRLHMYTCASVNFYTCGLSFLVKDYPFPRPCHF